MTLEQQRRHVEYLFSLERDEEGNEMSDEKKQRILMTAGELSDSPQLRIAIRQLRRMEKDRIELLMKPQ